MACFYVCVRGRFLAKEGTFNAEGGAVGTRHYDDWTVESWRMEPRLRAFEGDLDDGDPNPPLWKDLTLASIVAMMLWGAAAMIFG